MNRRELKVKRILKQLDATTDPGARSHYSKLLMRYWRYEPPLMDTRILRALNEFGLS